RLSRSSRSRRSTVRLTRWRWAPRLDQGALYTLLVERLLADLALDPSLVSRRLVLICPRNVAMKPCLSERDVSACMRRIRRLLDSIPVAGGQPVAPFGDVARAAGRTVALSSRRRGWRFVICGVAPG